MKTKAIAKHLTSIPVALILLFSTLTSAIAEPTSSHSKSASALMQLPEPVSNNAVAHIKLNQQDYLLSFSGLGQNKTFRDVHNKAFAYHWQSNRWQTIESVPIAKPVNGLIGRLASTAVGIGKHAYVFGGYTVAKDHSEVSVPDVYRYDLSTNSYQALTPMPVPVDDSTALAYKNRYIYLVSGWHNDGNVNLVQVYDSKTDTWQQASPFPGASVFGQAGAIVDNKIVVCDGVKVDYHLDKRRTFSAEAACYIGTINRDNVAKIDWRKLKHPTGVARYRMASAGLQNTMIFVGGSDNPYNYNGIGYNGEPSTASNQLWRLNLKTLNWQVKELSIATMDHRGLLMIDNAAVTLGGMDSSQKVLSSINVYQIITN